VFRRNERQRLGAALVARHVHLDHDLLLKTQEQTFSVTLVSVKP
jgi:hypothetical protein